MMGVAPIADGRRAPSICLAMFPFENIKSKRIARVALLLALMCSVAVIGADIAAAADGELVPYTSTENRSYLLHRFSGRYVSLLLPDSWMPGVGLTIDQRRRLIDQLDLTYSFMKDLIGAEPQSDGLLPIAVVDLPSSGRALIGQKMMEIATSNLLDTRLALSDPSGALPTTFTHEMAHDFDLFESQLAYYSDWAHAWTSFLVPFTETYNFTGTYPESIPLFTRESAHERFYVRYLGNPGTSWAACVRSGGGCGDLQANMIWAGVTLRVAELQGPAAIRGFMRELLAHRGEPPLTTPEAMEDRHLEALAAGAQRDLGCYADAWRWTLSTEARSRMHQRYGDNPFCADSDGDAFSTLFDDFDDADPNVHPGATETANGKDDDCDGVIDDLAYDEPTAAAATTRDIAFPARITGRLTTIDEEDKLAFNLPSAAVVIIHAQTSGDYPFSAEFRPGGQPAVGGIGIGQGSAEVIRFRYQFAAGPWVIALHPDSRNGATSGGSYRLTFSPAPPDAHGWGSVVVESVTGNQVRLTAMVRSMPFGPADTVRFFITRFGFVSSVPVQPTPSYVWTIPPDLPPGTLEVRAQLFKDGLPVSGVTTGVPIVISSPRRRSVMH
jgi:hypothetical protein